uniref:PC4 and SFRS1-interacting protein n=1 Tax=Cacopsylla melanoneura TaxID=428564 RepID=A0A8D8TMQ6_9HEMI
MSAKTNNSVENISLNDRVFAKMKSYPIWPAKIIEILDNDKVKVFFYGTHDCAIVPLSNVTKYEKLKNNIPKTKLKAYPAAVKEIKQDVNNKLFSCEKIKRYQKNTNKKKDDASRKAKAEIEEKNTKKRKMVTNSISEKGGPSKKPKKNQIPVDFSIFSASELYLECSTPENIPVRMHISDVLTKDILSTLPDYSKDPVKWKTFVLCIVDFIKCKIIKGEPVPHEVQNNIDVIVENNRSQGNIPSPTPGSKLNGMTTSSTHTKDKTKTPNDSKVKRSSRKRSRSTEEIESLFKTKVIPNEIHKDESGKEKSDTKDEIKEKEDEKLEKENVGINEKEDKDIDGAEENTGELEEIKTEEKSEEKTEISGEDDLDKIEKKSEDKNNIEKSIIKQEEDFVIEESNSVEAKENITNVIENTENVVTEESNSTEMNENAKSVLLSQDVENIAEQSSATNEHIQRQSPLFQNKKLLAKYMNYFNKRKLKLDLNEINNLAKMLDSKQENNGESCQQNDCGSSSESRRYQESTDTDINPRINDEGELEKLTVREIEEPQHGNDDAKNKFQTDLKETNNEIPKKIAPSSEANDGTTEADTRNVTHANILSSDSASCSYSNKNNVETTNGVNLNTTNTPLDVKKTELGLNDISNRNQEKSNESNDTERPTYENNQQTKTNGHVKQNNQQYLSRNQVPTNTLVSNTSNKQALFATDRNIQSIQNVPMNHMWKPNNWDTSLSVPRTSQGYYATHESATDYDGRRLGENTATVNAATNANFPTTSNSTTNANFASMAGSTATHVNAIDSMDSPTNNDNGRPNNHHFGHISNTETLAAASIQYTSNAERHTNVANTSNAANTQVTSPVDKMSNERRLINTHRVEDIPYTGNTTVEVASNERPIHTNIFENSPNERPVHSNIFENSPNERPIHTNVGNPSSSERTIHTSGVDETSNFVNSPCDLTEPQLNDLVHELFQQEAQALLLHVRLMQSLSFNKNLQSACSESDLLSAVQILSDLYHMKLNQFVLLRNPQLVFTCRLIAKCSRDLVDKNNNSTASSSNLPSAPTTPTMDAKSLLDTITCPSSLSHKTSHSSSFSHHAAALDKRSHHSSSSVGNSSIHVGNSHHTLDKTPHSNKISHAQFHAKSLETTAIRFLQYVSRIFEFRSGENFYDQFQHELAKFYTKTKNMTWSDMIYLAEQCIGNSIW